MYQEVVCAAMLALAVCALPALAQQPGGVVPGPLLPRTDLKLPSFPIPGCEHTGKTDLTLRNRFCYEVNRMLSTGGMVQALTRATYSEWEHPGSAFGGGSDNAFAMHLERFYVRRSAADFGEMLGGYLHHEPIVRETSGKTGWWRRSRAALFGVLAITDTNGSRMAFGPIAGSLASGFVTIECCGYQQTAALALRRSGFTYGGYLTTALFREFQPDLKAYARRKFHR